jgi:hypothetical protein
MIFPDPKVDPPLRDQLHVLHNPSPQRAPTQPIGRIITLLRAVKADHQRWDGRCMLEHSYMAAPSGRCMRDILGLCREVAGEVLISVV